MSIAKNLSDLRVSLPAGVTLVAVSKTHPVEAILEAYCAGQRVFGENRPQEMAAKRVSLAALPDPPADIRWHQIGHLQTNKVKLIAPFVDMIHSVDSARLAVEISRQAAALGRAIDVLLEIRIAREQSKEGWAWDELVAWLEGGQWRELAGVRFRGVMGVATFTDDETVVSGEFERLTAMHADLRERFFLHGDNCPRGSHFNTISMGMSDDYPLAIAAGSTMVRIGCLVFGARQYG
jgi:pyridoxal phosphate enzyme (YggS family)